MTRLLPALRVMKCSAIALLVGTAALPVAALAQGGDHVIDFALGAPVLTLDPGVAAGTQAQTARVQIMEGLVQLNAETSEIEPLLAESWEVADDGVTWTFHLREGVRFHDGSPLTADDVVASIGRIIDPASGMGRANDLRQITEIAALDDSTVKIVTAAPSGTLLRVLALDSASILSTAAIEEYGDQIGWHPVGTGPFKYESHVAEQSITFVRNDDYWGKVPEADGVKFITVPEASTRLTMLETGEADIIVDVPGADVERLRETDGISLIEKPNTRLGHVGMNVSRAPLNDVKVRQAINFAINREAIVKGVLRGVGVPADSIIAPTVAGYVPQDMYGYDPQKARDLLAEAGYPNGFDITMWTPQGRYYMDRETMIAVQALLGQVGIRANVEVVDWSTYLSALREPVDGNKSQLYWLGWESGTADIQVILDTVFDGSRMPPNGWNTMFYKNDKVDELRAAMSREVDPDKRQDMAAEVQKIIMTDAPWAPVYSYVQVSGYNSDIDGIEYLPTDVYRLKNVTFK
ncbi:ABC transporter substrate-binding protein [Acuticoccus sediminis]|uniref:ABC transporter substrate-binding protein n=1 Tax=Acuticoccus sediminis TaxID=2184697 RepID=UPI001CFD20CC|nr:ABC transporter substrate-binding protein [Acuticoccus sediminis]